LSGWLAIAAALLRGVLQMGEQQAPAKAQISICGGKYMAGDAIKKYATLSNAILIFALVQFVWLGWYFYTGLGGPVELVSRVMSIALVLQILFMYRDNNLYPWLPPAANHALVAIYIAIAAYAFWHFLWEYERIAIYSQGSFSTQDYIVGVLVFLLVMELTRLAHPILFWINLVMVLYTLYGFIFPQWLDFFWHPGVSFYRVVTSSTVELSTGIYGSYGQLALTLIAAFLLLAAAARGFGAQAAMINVMRRLAGRRRQMVPQTAVLGSLSVGMISGSGSANAVVVGSITIPLMKRYGVPGTFAGAVETAASMGGLIMPPLMGVGAFLMSEFLGVPYWEVVLRGFALGAVYYISLALAVYLLCVRLLPRDEVDAPKVPAYQQIKTGIFFAAVLFLIVLMGWIGVGELRAALLTAVFMFVLLLATYLLFIYVLKDPQMIAEETDSAPPDRFVGWLIVAACLVVGYLFRNSSMAIGLWVAIAAGFALITVAAPALLKNFRLTLETHADMTSYLTLLLATLGIMIGLFTVTGFINRMGGMLLEVGSWSLIATILMAYVFGWLVGAGLPPTATYVIGAVIIVGPLRELGINPWVAHFFVFLLSVWGELSPPTSLTAAISARIAEASFMRTMWEALKICMPITLMTFAIFTRSDMVVNPGWPQIAATALVLISTCGITLAMFGRFTERSGIDIALRVLLAATSLLCMFHPSDAVSTAVAMVLVPALIAGIWRHAQVAPPKDFVLPEGAIAASDQAPDLGGMAAEAKRDYG
jgi:TRAP transporter 4TM/12TM fusion protein